MNCFFLFYDILDYFSYLYYIDMVRDFFENVYIYISEYYIVISFIYYIYVLL